MMNNSCLISFLFYERLHPIWNMKSVFQFFYLEIEASGNTKDEEKQISAHNLVGLLGFLC